MDDVVEMRDVMVRTKSDRCTLVIDMTINNHYVYFRTVLMHWRDASISLHWIWPRAIIN